MTSPATPKTPRAARTPLSVGEHTAERVTPKKTATGYIVICSVKIPTTDGAGETQELRRTRPTKGEARRAAREEAERRIAAAQAEIDRQAALPPEDTGAWSGTDSVATFITTVSIPGLENHGYEEKTVNGYRDMLKLALGECNRPDCVHTKSLASKNLAQITYGDGAGLVIKQCLEELAPLHGTTRTKKLMSVLNTHLYGPLQLVSSRYTNPLDSRALRKQLHLGDHQKIQRGPVREALTADEYETAIQWFLAIDPEVEASRPRRGPSTIEEQREKIRNGVTLTLLAAATGARRNELQHVQWHEITDTAEGMVVHISRPKKTSDGKAIPRGCLVTDYRVEDYLIALKHLRSPADTDFVIGAPRDPSKLWDDSNASKVIRTRKGSKVIGLYDRCADETGIDKLRVHAFHVWRRTLETRMIMQGVSQSVRTAQMGHGGAVAEKHYADHKQMTHLVAPARIQRPGPRAVG